VRLPWDLIRARALRVATPILAGWLLATPVAHWLGITGQQATEGAGYVLAGAWYVLAVLAERYVHPSLGWLGGWPLREVLRKQLNLYARVHASGPGANRRTVGTSSGLRTICNACGSFLDRPKRSGTGRRPSGGSKVPAYGLA
jgi:hypothetical protein